MQFGACQYIFCVNWRVGRGKGRERTVSLPEGALHLPAAAVDDVVLPGDVAGLVAGQEADHLGALGEGARAAHKRVNGHAGRVVVDRAGRDGVDQHALRGDLLGQGRT